MDKKLTINERKMLLDVAIDVANECKKNKETKADTEKIVVACLHHSVNELKKLKLSETNCS